MKAPTVDELRKISNELNFHLGDSELNVFVRYFEREVSPAFAALESAKNEAMHPITRDHGHFPSKEENQFGAWAWKCSIKGNSRGLLSGKKIALKDNVSLAGVPMTNGTAIMKDYIPRVDSEVARRIITAGGEIVGKATCENFCWTGGSFTSYPQRVLNPHNTEFMAGGSSSGSAALVAAGEVEMAIGADQGGSIRIPSSWCGVYGLKPTYGLVPYTGVITGEMTFDHVGPIGKTVEDVAMLLQAVAGRDGQDPRQSLTPVELPGYFDSIDPNISGLKIGLVREGFGWKESEPDVEERVRKSAYKFEELGAKVDEVSIPIHRTAGMLMMGIDMEGSWRALKNNGVNFGAMGFQDEDLGPYLGVRLYSGEGDISANTKLIALFGEYMIRNYHGRFYAKSQNIRPSVRKAYNDALDSFDLLLMSTTPQKAQPFPKLDDFIGMILAGWNMTSNVAPFDYTGHPAMNVPCGTSDGLPVGMMIVGRHFAEQTILNAALAFERMS